jgi:P4 family phage/plasmid primase-like protien
MSFNNFLSKFKTGTETTQTHLSFVNGKYNIPVNEIPGINKIYFEAIKANEHIYLMEKITNTNYPFFLDIDLPKDTNYILNAERVSGQDIVTIDDIKLITNLFNDILKNHVIDPVSDFIVSRRMVNEGTFKYHINYPELPVNCEIASILANLLIDKLGGNLKTTIDKSVYRTALRMLGSRKNKEDNAVYRLFDIDTEEYIELTFDLFTKTLLKHKTYDTVISLKNNIPQNCTVKSTTDVKATVISSDLEGDIVRYTKNELNLENVKIKTVIKENLSTHYITFCTSKVECPFKMREHQRSSCPVYLDISSYGIFMKCYDSDCVGQSKKIELKDDFEIDYPELSKNMKQKYIPVPLNITPTIKKLLENSLSGTHYQIAKVIFHIYKDTYRVDGIKNPEWYHFDGIRWKKTYFFNILVSEEIPRYYKSLLTSDESVGEESTEESTEITKAQLIKKIITNLENVIFKRNILDQCVYLFMNHDPVFTNKLDANPLLIGFKNGVYDLEASKFRDGKCEDYLTFSTGYEFLDYNADDHIVKDIFSFLSKIIPSKEVREYLLVVLAKTLIGIPDEKFYIFTGLSGSNGKSTLMNFLEYTLGDYMTSVDSSLLTNKKGLSSSASPDIIRMRGKRLFSFAEPENVDLQTGTLKQFSGGDTIVARELYKAPITFKLQGTMIMCCNEQPKIANLEGGIIRRVRVIDFNSKFCENPVKANEFAIDKQLNKKLKNWKPYFMSILLHFLQFKDSVIEPEEVKLATNNYIGDNDKFEEFFRESVVDDRGSFESLKDIYNNFCEWYQDNYKNEKTPKLSQFKTKIRLLYGNEISVKGRKGYNVRLNSSVDDQCIFE